MVEGAIKHLPVTGAELFGRDAELAWLDACWRDGVFVTSIVAWGGVGKTSLVTKWLARMRDDGWRGAERIYDWSFYRQGTNTAGSSDTFFADALAKFGDPDPTAGSPWDKGERLAKLVREKRTLLVLDGVEPMQYGPGPQEGQFKDPALQTLVKELASNNNGFLLITSRLQLADLNGLSGAKVQTKALEHLSAEAGAALLRGRGAKGPDDELQQAANEYRGHALALTLLGSYLEEVAEGDIRRRNEIGPLHHDERNGGHARRVMTSYESLLGKTELAILRMLGLFDRPATSAEIAALRAAPAVPGLTDVLVGVGERNWNRALAKLRRIGLIAADTVNVIDAHPLVRQHFSEQLKLENTDAFREGHRRLYEFLRTSAKEFPETIAEMEPLYKAVVHGCLADKKEEALFEVFAERINQQISFYSTKTLGAFANCAVTLAAFFDSPWECLSSGLSPPGQAFVFNESSFALRALGRLEESAALMRMPLAKNVELQAWLFAAKNASNLAEVLQARGLLLESLAIASECVSLALISGNLGQVIVNTTTLASVQHDLGRYDEAAALCAEAEVLQNEDQPHYPLLYSLQGFRYCDILLDKGLNMEVQQRAGLTLIWADAQKVTLERALDHLSLARAHLAGFRSGSSCDLYEANSHIMQAMVDLRLAGYQEHICQGLFARAELHIHTHAFADARRDLHEAMIIATRCGFRLHECDAHLGYARLACAEGKLAKSRKHIEKARTLVNETGYHRRDRDLAELEAMTRNQLHDALCKLRESELDTLIFKLDVPTAMLPGKSSSAAERVSEVLRWAEARSRLDEVEQLYQEFMASGATPSATPATAPTAPAPNTPSPATSNSASTASVPTTTTPPNPVAAAVHPELAKAYLEGKLAILFGSGLSKSSKTSTVHGDFPGWTDFPDRLLGQAAQLGIWSQAQLDAKRDFFKGGHLSLEGMLAELDTLKTALRGARKYRAALSSIFRPANAAAGDVHHALVETAVPVLLTTNYDALLELVEGPPARQVFTWKNADQALDDIQHSRKVLFKIHGTADDAESVVMTRAEYEVAAKHAPYQHTMSYLLQAYTFLLVGYGINDPLDLDLIFELNNNAFGHAARPHYALMKNPSPTDRDRWQRELNIQTIPYGDHDELPGILRALAATKGSTNPP